MQTIKNLIAYLKRHPGYIKQSVYDILKLFWYKCSRKKILVITTGSGGIGDYLWIRSYYPLIRQKKYKIVLIAMAHWNEIVDSYDKNNVDIIRYFESCVSPKKIEIFFFKLIRFDVYLNFCKECIAPFVKCKIQYTNTVDVNYDWFYEKRNNYIFSKFYTLPDTFRHSIPIIEPTTNLKMKLKPPYVIITEGGNTHGRFNDIQLKSIIQHLLRLNYQVLFNGNKKSLTHILTCDELTKVVDGYLFPFPQYGYLIQQAEFVITVNTSIYHFALLLNKPCIIITPYEPRTIKINQQKQIAVYNDIIDENNVTSPLKHSDEEKQYLLHNTNINRIIDAIDIMHNTKQ